MKAYSLRHHINFFALLSLLIPTLTGSFCKAADLQYNSMEMLLEDFMTLDKHPSASFVDFAKALVELIKKNPKFNDFRAKLEKNINSKNANLIGLLFKQHQSLFPQNVRSKLTGKNENELKDIFSKRINK